MAAAVQTEITFRNGWRYHYDLNGSRLLISCCRWLITIHFSLTKWYVYLDWRSDLWGFCITSDMGRTNQHVTLISPTAIVSIGFCKKNNRLDFVNKRNVWFLRNHYDLLERNLSEISIQYQSIDYSKPFSACANNCIALT